MIADRTQGTSVRRAEPASRKPTWLDYGDAMRCVSALAVVLHHTAMQGPLRHGDASHLAWVVYTVAVRGTQWAVPVFFMLSGALLLDPAREESAATFYRKRFGRVGIPFAFWLVFYVLWSVFRHVQPTPRAALIAVVRGHLWFLFCLVTLYAITPLVRRVMLRVGPKAGACAAFALLAMASAWVAYAAQTGVQWPMAVALVRYAGYYLAGFYLRTASHSVFPRYAAAAGACAIFSHLAFFTAHSTGGEHSRQLGLWMGDNLSPYMVALSLCVFILLRDFMGTRPRTNERTTRVLHAVSGATLGVYIVHPAVQDLTAAWWVLVPAMSHWANLLVLTAVVFCGGLLVTLALAHASVLRAVVGYAPRAV